MSTHSAASDIGCDLDGYPIRPQYHGVPIPPEPPTFPEEIAALRMENQCLRDRLALALQDVNIWRDAFVARSGAISVDTFPG